MSMDSTRHPVAAKTGGRGIALMIGAGLSLAVVAYHLVAGTAEVMVPTYAAALPPEVVGVLDVVWYDVALLVLIGGVGMLVAARRPDWRRPLAWFIGGHYLLLSLICVVLSLQYFGNLWGLIQWAFFAPLGLLTIWAATTDRPAP